MGAGTSRSGSAANLNDAGAFVRQQEQKAAAATRGRANRMNTSQPGQSNREDFSLNRFDTLLSNLEREKEKFNQRKVRGMSM